MKKILILLSIILISCTNDKNEIENIEILSYIRNFDSNHNSYIQPELYSIILPNGNCKTINYSGLMKNKFVESTINEGTLNNISAKTLKLNSDYFKIEEGDYTNDIYCGLESYTRFRIKYKKRKSINFIHLNRAFKTNKYFEFNKLKNEIYTNKKNNILDNDTIKLLNSMKEFKIFSESFNEFNKFPIKAEIVKFRN
jgi:hypothetical protein